MRPGDHRHRQPIQSGELSINVWGREDATYREMGLRADAIDEVAVLGVHGADELDEALNLGVVGVTAKMLVMNRRVVVLGLQVVVVDVELTYVFSVILTKET